MKKTSNSQRFLTYYNQLDDFMRKYLHRFESYNIHSSLLEEMKERNLIFRNEKTYNELMQYSRLRNAIVHNHEMHYADPIAEPHIEIVKRYGDIISMLLKPPKALQYAIPSGKIYTTTPDALALDVMKIMGERSYTHLPVIEGGLMIGVFSESSVFSYLVDHPNTTLGSDLHIRQFADYIDIEKHGNEYFTFVGRETVFAEVEEIFQRGIQKGRRIAVVYITEHGNIEEKLLGMITPWDLINHRDDANFNV